MQKHIDIHIEPPLINSIHLGQSRLQRQIWQAERRAAGQEEVLGVSLEADFGDGGDGGDRVLTTWVMTDVPIFQITQPLGINGLLDGYYFGWCPIFPKWDIYQPLDDESFLEIPRGLLLGIFHGKSHKPNKKLNSINSGIFKLKTSQPKEMEDPLGWHGYPMAVSCCLRCTYGVRSHEPCHVDSLPLRLGQGVQQMRSEQARHASELNDNLRAAA